MGNGLGKIGLCFSGTNDCGGGRRGTAPSPDPYDDTMGHSFIYTRPDPAPTYSDPTPTTLFRSISGASVSANTSTPLSTAPTTTSSTSTTLSSAFDSSTSFSSIPLHPIPKSFLSSGPLSGPTDSTFLSGPIDRAFMSGPLDRPGPLHKTSFKRSLSQTGEPGPSRSMIRGLKRAISKKLSRGQRSIVAPMKGGEIKYHDTWVTDHDSVQWAQGKAGEDRVHVVVSDDHGLVFVGIYDGFHGPDATDFLLTNLYSSLQDEIKGLLWDDHSEVLSAMSRGLKRTEEGYFEVADTVIAKNPELSLMGSCVLVVLMKGEDVYVMNVGDSRAVLGTKRVSEFGIGIVDKDLERINEESCYDVEMMFDGVRPTLSAFQLSLDHSTAVDEEVQRIRSEHPDDSCAVVQDRVKGSLMVTRAFGAGYLKQPKWNDALLEMFRIDYVGTSSYMNCLPSLHHHRLGPNDRFLILSSDGLYQYFTNEEAVSEVELFTSLYPDGDPAQHLVEEVLFRAAKKAGMDFYELLEIPQGERRRYHDDVSIVIISFEGMIWRSCV